MKLKHLIQQIKGFEVRGSKEIVITGLSAHSKLIAPGNLFVAKKGKTCDGAEFIRDAVAAGASAILTDMYNPFLEVTQLIHPNVYDMEGKLAARFFHDPSKSLQVIGVTGTNGKTTVSFLIRHLFEGVGIPCGLIGGVEWIVGEHCFPSSLTTPDVITNHKLLSDMRGVGSQAAVMEVSSHALDQNRVNEIDFSMAIFTNLTPEHFDYHGNMESYKRAKAKLFEGLSEERWAIFNADDPTSFPTRAKTFTYGIESRADLMAKQLRLSDKKSQCILSYKGEERECKSLLIGKYNVYNLLAAISAGLCSGLSLEACIAQVKTFKGARGRLQRVKEGIFVDHAHKEDALRNVLQTLREMTKGRLITVFGCGGDRDREKRPKMGKIATDLSDIVIVTSDNPRSENPEKIVEEIVSGCNGKPVSIELDRENAIRSALLQKTAEDIVLIAGKGHETEQIFAHHVVPFNDAEIVRKIHESICIG